MDATDEIEHVVAALGIKPVRRLIEEDELGVVGDRLGEFDALLHAGGEALDRTVALLLESHVVEDVGGTLAGGATGQPGDLGHVGDEIGGSGIHREAIGLRHVTDKAPNGEGVGAGVEAEDAGVTGIGRGEPEEALDEGGFAGAIGPEEADCRARNGQIEGIQGREIAVALGEALGLDGPRSGGLRRCGIDH